MTHLLVTQLHFARSQFQHGFEGVTDAEAQKRILPMNSLSWIVGHLANQENGYWNVLAQDLNLAPGLNALVGFGKPASTPPMQEMWAIWQVVTASADRYLETLTPAILTTHLSRKGRTHDESVGTLLMRNIYHYWYHIGEAQGIRQAMGHTNLPPFIGDMTSAAYHPE